MKCKRISLIAAVPMSLALAGFAFGQVPPNHPPEQTTPPAQRQYPQTRQNQPMNNRMNRMRNPDNRSGDFSQLAGSKGYVTRSEASNDPWLSQHFSQCDRDNNGKVSRSEYQQCHRSQGSLPRAP
jgi:hypothetical protein